MPHCPPLHPKSKKDKKEGSNSAVLENCFFSPESILLMAGHKNQEKQIDSLYQISLTRKKKAPNTIQFSHIFYTHHSTFGDVSSRAHKIRKGQFQSQTVFFLLVKHLVVTKHSGPWLVKISFHLIRKCLIHSLRKAT